LKQKLDQIIIYTDGGSRGNPGPAAAGFILNDTAGTQLQAKAFFLGRTTNNVAEYTAVCKALEAADKIGAESLTVFTDSELLTKQLNGQYKVKSDNIKPIFRQTLQLLGKFKSCVIQHISREQNKQADSLVNRALNLEQDIDAAGDLEQSTQTLCERQAASGEKPIRLGVLISGGGTTLMNILEYIEQGRLNAQVVLVICSRSKVAGVERAKTAGLKVTIIRKKDHSDIDEFSSRIENELASAYVDLVVQGGWLCLWKIPARYRNRVMNIHPALLPSFGGQGMWGHYVHEAVLRAGCKVSGCTVHFCSNEYDKGPIIVQRTCLVEEDDTHETLASRVFQQECIAYPQAIKLFAEGKLSVRDNKVKIKE